MLDFLSEKDKKIILLSIPLAIINFVCKLLISDIVDNNQLPVYTNYPPINAHDNCLKLNPNPYPYLLSLLGAIWG
jgi:hypothetical protein